MELKWHTEQRKVNDLIAYDKNPRFLTPEQEIDLTNSLKKFDLVEIPAIDLDNTLIAGHQRTTIMYKLGRGDELIDVRVPNRKLTEAEFKEYNIRSNANTGSWDVQLLATEFDVPDLTDWGLDISKMKGFVTEGVDEEKEIPELPELPVVKRGDIFQLGNHTIMCGDAKSSEDIEKLMSGRLAQMVFTDPPYNVRISGLGSKTVFDKKIGKNRKATNGISQIHREFKEASGEMTVVEFTDFLTAICKNLFEFSIDGSIHYICMDWKHINELLTGANNGGLILKQLCVWNKDNGGMGTFYRSKHELIFVFKHGNAKHINNFELGQNGRYRTNVWDYPIVTSFANKDRAESKLHPTVKPLELVSDAIFDCSNRGGLVLDLFLGNGTTLLSSEKTGRICYGTELDEGYCEVIIKRFHNYMVKQDKQTLFRHLNGDLVIEDILKTKA